MPILNTGMAAAADPAEGSFASKGGRALAFACSFTVCLLAAGALAVTLLGRPHGGIIRLDLRDNIAPKTRPAAGEIVPAAVADGPAMAAVTKPLYAGKALLADPALVQNVALGPLPRIADDGTKPMTAYAAPAMEAGKKFRIAIVVNGLGMSAPATKAALDGLPPAVTLGFEPYAGDVSQWVSAARAKGHEVLLEIPMEPFDFPESDPGPHTLRAGQDQDANVQRLNWALSRFTGYAGVTNLLGQRLLTDTDALSPVLTSLNRRGLYFFDNGAAAQSVAPTVASQLGMPAAQSGAPIDTIQTALEIDRRLSELETQARANGSAAGSAFLYPVTLTRIAQWARGLESRGFVLVPVSAIVSQPK